jgi:toluene methyl-monooxygenase
MVMDYLRYYLNCLLPLAAIAGFVLGGHWVWLGIGTLPLLILADALSPQDYAPRRIANGALADVVIYVQMLLVLGTFVAFACQRACPHDALQRMDMRDLPRLVEWLDR